MQQIVYKKYNAATKQASVAPVTLEWNNARMIRSQSIKACVRELLSANMGKDLVRINLIGPPSTGKTVLAGTLAHLIHELANSPFAVRRFNRDDLMNMEEVLANLTPINHVMIFDDISWLSGASSKQKLDQIQKTFTEIRHLPGGQNIKLFIIFNFHYNLSVPKHLRQADFFCYTEIGSSEIENTLKIIGGKHLRKVIEFVDVVQQAQSTGIPATSTTPETPGTFSYKLGNKGMKFTYTFRHPYGPALWWNRRTCRHIVFPKREWIDPLCQTCSDSIQSTPQEQMDVKKFKADITKTWGKSNPITPLRIKFYQMGINVFPPITNQQLRWIDKYMEHKTFNLEDLAKEFGLEVAKTQLHKKLPPDILALK